MKNIFKLTPIFLTLALLLSTTQVSAIRRDELTNYASSLKGLKKAELKEALHLLMNKNKTVLEYGSGDYKTWWGFWYTDRVPATNECINRYSAKKFHFSGETNSGQPISGMNIEHSFPKSWWGGTKNDAYKDLIHLYPSESEGNSDKSNYPMGIVTQIDQNKSDEEYDKLGTGYVNGKNQRCWEPGNQFKGDFARTYMYMAVTYSNLTFKKMGLETMDNSPYPGLKEWAYTLYLSWTRQDKVSQMEVDRNNAVYNIQHNRDLFVDYPFLSEYIWGDSTEVAFDPATSITTADGDSRYDSYVPAPSTTPTPTPTTPSDKTYLFRPVDEITSSKQYLIVVNNNGKLLSAQTVQEGREYGFLYAEETKAEENNMVSLTTMNNAFILEESNGGYYIKDTQGRYLYNDNEHDNFNITTDKTKAGTWAIQDNRDGTFEITMNNHYIQFEEAYNSFGCYQYEVGIVPMLYEYESTLGITPAFLPNKHKTADNRIFNLNGQQVDKNYKGVVIRNGVKYINK